VALTVRREGTASSGTISRPIAVALDLSRVEPPVIERRQKLGYEALPSTAVYAIRASKRFELKLGRGSDDRYAAHIQVTAIDGSGRAVYQLTRADGQGEWQQLAAGEYRIVAALLIPEEVELALTIAARPARVRLAAAVADGNGGGLLTPGRGIPLIAEGDSPHQVRLEQPALQGAGGGSDQSVAELLAVAGSTGRVRATSSGAFATVASLAPMEWVDAFGRPMGPSVLLVPVALSAPVLVSGTDWAVSVRFAAQDGSGYRDLSDLVFTAEIWDQERAFRYALCSVVTGTALLGGPVTAALTPAQTAMVGRYDGEQVVFDLRAQDATGRLAYLLEGLVTVRWGVSIP